MPSGTRPTPIVATTARVARSMTDTLRPSRSVIQSSVPRGCTATSQGPLPTGTVAATVPLARFTSETVSSRKLVMAANVPWHVCSWQRPPWQTLHTSPSPHLVPSGSIWQVGEQQSPAAVLPSSHVSPASTIPLPQIAPGIVVVVVVVVGLGREVVVVVVVEVVVLVVVEVVVVVVVV